MPELKSRPKRFENHYLKSELFLTTIKNSNFPQILTLFQVAILQLHWTNKQRLVKNDFGSSHPDQKYIEGIRAKDGTVIKAIFKEFFPSIKAYVLKNQGTINDAEDLFHESLKIIFLQAQRGLLLQHSFGGFLHTICKRRWINVLNRQSRFKNDIENQPEPTTDQSVIADLIADEKQLLFRRHFKKLHERCQEILSLSFEGLNYRKIAEQLKLNYSFVRRRGGECIKSLTDSIKGDPIYRELKEE